MMHQENVRQQFAALVAGPEETLELDRAALLIAAEEYPKLAIESYVLQLEKLAEECQKYIEAYETPSQFFKVSTLGDYLFGQGRFKGNADDYYDIRNSFLNEVLDRGRGIPITLSVLFIEVGRRLGLKLWGVGMPGHFLVKYLDEGNEVFFDPYHGGKILTVGECHQRIAQMFEGQILANLDYLRAVTKKEIISRMLQNLKGIYFQTSDMTKALGVIERLLLLHPASPTEIRDYGLACYALKKYGMARTALEKYLRTSSLPDDEKQKITEVLHDLYQKLAGLN